MVQSVIAKLILITIHARITLKIIKQKRRLLPPFIKIVPVTYYNSRDTSTISNTSIWSPALTSL